jgi:hypothetical protein
MRLKIVAKIRLYPEYLRVLYKSGVYDRYYFSGNPSCSFVSFKVTQADMHIGKEIPIHQNYELDPLNTTEQEECAHHFLIERKDATRGSLIDQRIVTHKLLTILTRLNPKLDRYPEQSIRKWIDELRGFPYRRMMYRNAYNFYRMVPFSTPWRQVLWQYYPPDLNYKRPLFLSWKLRQLFEHKKRTRISTAELNKSILRWHSKNTLNPLTYCAFIKALGAKSIIDLHPRTGYKAIACGLLGVEYYAPRCEEFDLAIDRGIGTTLGLVHNYFVDQNADTIISDGYFNEFDIESATPYVGNAKSLVCYAPRSDRIGLTEKYKPSKVHKVMVRYRQGREFKETGEDPDFLFTW